MKSGKYGQSLVTVCILAVALWVSAPLPVAFIILTGSS
jgi:hypothetical protein